MEIKDFYASFYEKFKQYCSLFINTKTLVFDLIEIKMLIVRNVKGTL